MNHYDWLEKFFQPFVDQTEAKGINAKGSIVAHGDKAYSYQNVWEEQGVPFHHGVALYLLTYLPPYSREVRETPKGWVAPVNWVSDNYVRFKSLLEKTEQDSSGG